MNQWFKYKTQYKNIYAWFFIWIGVYILVYRYIYEKWPFWLLIGSLLLNVLYIIKNHVLCFQKSYKFYTMLELFIISFCIIYQGDCYVAGTVLYLLYIFEIIIQDKEICSFLNYSIYSLPFIITSLTILITSFTTITNKDWINKILYLIFFMNVFFIFVYIFNLYVQEYLIQLHRNQWLCEQMNKKNQELYETQHNMKHMNQELQKQKEELQQMNEKFRKSIAEFYILKEIGNYIGSVLELEQLLDMITDMIMGVMGVDTCSIALWDNKQEELTFQVNSIYSENIIEKFKTHAKNKQLLHLINNSHTYVENHVISKNKQYSFLDGRKVGSFIAVPLSKNNIIYGFILVEHQLESYFSKSSIEFFKAVSAQIVMAIENARLYKKTEEMATKDGLTGIYNRTYLNQILPKMIEWSKNHHQPLAVSIFDIDSFKKVNDSYGHLFGDKVLQIVAQLGKAKVESYGGIISRYGGEEFILLLPGYDLDAMVMIVDELRQEIANYPIQDGNVLTYVQASFGVSAYPQFAKNSIELVQSADTAMYRSKQLGKNRVISAKLETGNKIK